MLLDVLRASKQTKKKKKKKKKKKSGLLQFAVGLNPIFNTQQPVPRVAGEGERAEGRYEGVGLVGGCRPEGG